MDSLYNDFVVKLNISALDIDLSRKTRSIEKHVKLKDRNNYGVIRDYLSVENTEKILNLLPEKIKESCIGITKSSISSLPPHIHTVEKCVINFYHKVSGEETVFYDGVYEVLTEDVEDSGKGYYIIDENKIKKVISYIAQDGEVYMLNTRKAHSVIDTNNIDNTRLILQVFLDMDFTKAYKILSDNEMVNECLFTSN